MFLCGMLLLNTYLPMACFPVAFPGFSSYIYIQYSLVITLVIRTLETLATSGFPAPTKPKNVATKPKNVAN